MAYCRNCGTELSDKIKFCPECGQPSGDIQTPPAPTPALPAETKKRPILGLVGILLLLIGFVTVLNYVIIGLLIILFGLGILIFALITGNVKVFG